MFFKRRKHGESADEERERIFILRQHSDEYYETLAFRFASCIGCLLELRKYSTSSYRGHIDALARGEGDRQWINVVTCPRNKQNYSVVMSGGMCGISDNPFKFLLERVCRLLCSCHMHRTGIGALSGSSSPEELDLRLTAAGY